jgi:hypothetical protein
MRTTKAKKVMTEIFIQTRKGVLTGGNLNGSALASMSSGEVLAGVTN